MSENKKFEWNGTEYELEETEWLPCDPFHLNTPYISFKGKFYVGKAVLKQSPADEYLGKQYGDKFEQLVYWATHSGWKYCQGGKQCGNEPILKLSHFNSMANHILKEEKEDTKQSSIGYEIECFVDDKFNYWRQKNGLYTNRPFDAGSKEIYFLNNLDKYKIHSVRRKSDGEIFYIGDKIGWGKVGNYETTIGAFKLNEDGGLEIGYNQDIKFSEFYFVNAQKAVNLHKKKTLVTKPPLGLRPRFILDEHRLKEINEAIERYIAADYPIPDGWIKERDDLLKLIKK